MPQPLILGAHESISGGLHNAVFAARDVGCDCVQIFSKNSNQWTAKPLTEAEVTRFRDALAECGIRLPLIHDSYLINLASPDEALWRKSVEALEREALRADALSVPNFVMHPGSFTTSSEEAGIARIAQGLEVVLNHTQGIQTRILLENMAGQGTNLGWKLDQLADMIRQTEAAIGRDGALGTCFDTCHAFGAGYDLSTPEKYAAFWDEFDAKIGLNRLCAIHLNDSAKGLGTRVDRHAHIGCGVMGLGTFRLLLNDPRFRPIPMYLETPKGTTDDGEDWDVVNLRVLRSLEET